MPLTLVTRYGILEKRVAAHDGTEVWTVHLDDGYAEAVVYPELIGRAMPGDRVLLNTTAMELNLGTGGQHIVMARAELGGTVPPPRISREDGHIIKMRYTPLQCRVMAAEEEASPYHDALQRAENLPGTPVVCLGLHSQLAPVVGGIKAVNPELRIGYLMTDSAALPAAYSQLVARLSSTGLLSVVVTAGQAFGGDLEAVNLYSGMVTAAIAGKADIIIAGQGPGNVGTGTPLGFGGIEQAMLLNAAASLQGMPIAVPRISFADPRDRHHGLSHHTATVLGRLTFPSVILPLPTLRTQQSILIQEQLTQHALTRHQMITVSAEPGIAFCQQADIPLRSMGRGYADDPAFFAAAAAAGRVAAERLMSM